MSEIKLLELSKQVKAEMISLGLSECSLRNYDYNGFRPIHNFFTNENEEMFSVQIARKCVFQARNHCEGGAITQERFRAIRKIETLLEEYYKNSTITWGHLPRWGCKELSQYFGNILSRYICEKEVIYSRNTINDYKSIIAQFLGFLEMQEHQNFNNISPKEISQFIPHIAIRCPSSMSGVMTALRSFVIFLENKEIVNSDIFSALQGVPAKRRKVFPGFSHDEADRILSAVNRETGTGKRDYAMLLLAKNTGLRSIDIVNLQRDNIDWQKDEIHIKQHKTDHLLILPLTSDVGNAIADYILHGRPTSDCTYIFLRAFAPLKKLADHGPFYAILSKYMKIAGVSHNLGERKGTHSFRRSIATWMFEADVSLSTISEILGHSNLNSSKPYISTNLEQLRSCTLDLDGIEVTRKEFL